MNKTAKWNNILQKNTAKQTLGSTFLFSFFICFVFDWWLRETDKTLTYGFMFNYCLKVTDIFHLVNYKHYQYISDVVSIHRNTISQPKTGKSNLSQSRCLFQHVLSMCLGVSFLFKKSYLTIAPLHFLNEHHRRLPFVSISSWCSSLDACFNILDLFTSHVTISPTRLHPLFRQAWYFFFFLLSLTWHPNRRFSKRRSPKSGWAAATVKETGMGESPQNNPLATVTGSESRARRTGCFCGDVIH